MALCGPLLCGRQLPLGRACLRPQRQLTRTITAGAGAGDGFRRPITIKWEDDFVNKVSLIGSLGKDAVLKDTENGKLAFGSLKTQETWFALTFCNELAEIAAQHAKKGERVHVEGELLIPKLSGYHKYKAHPRVIVKKFQFIQRADPSQLAKMWQNFFAAPDEYWDNRFNKKNPKGPDFKHKDTHEALWLSDNRIPSWVLDQIKALESKGVLKSSGSS